MRIISKFPDYYDSALAYGFDNDRTLVRHFQQWNPNDKNIDSPELLKKLHTLCSAVTGIHLFGNIHKSRFSGGNKPSNEHMQIYPVAFCVGGRVTKALWILRVHSKRLNAMTDESDYMPPMDPLDQLKNTNAFVKHSQEHILFEGPVFSNEELAEATNGWFNGDETKDHSAVVEKKYHFLFSTTSEKFKNLCRWLNSPAPDLYTEALSEKIAIAVVHKQNMAVNTLLQGWKFYRYWDAATCMQELSMFVGNMALNEPAMVVTDDKYKVASHGFDERSFRKQPTKNADPKQAKRPHPDSPSP